MTDSGSTSNAPQTERPRRWFLEHGVLATGAGTLMVGARAIGIDTILILWAGLAGNTMAQDITRFVFTDLMPAVLLISGFGLYLLARGLSIDGDTGTVTPLDTWVARLCGVLLVAYIGYLIL